MPPTEAPAAPAAAEPATATIDAPASGEKAPSDFMADVMGDFADMESGKAPAPKAENPKPAAPEKKQAPAKPVSQPKPAKPEEDKEPAKEEAKQDEGEKKHEDDKSKPSEPEKPQGGKFMRTLGERYDNLKKQVEQEFKPEIQRLKSKVQEYESKKSEDAVPLLEKVKQLEARNQELEKHIQYVDYTQSEDFREKYSKPYADAWSDAMADFRQLEVTEKVPDGVDEMGEPKFKVTTRPATEDDLIALGSLGLSKLAKAATKMFEESAPTAINHIQNLKKLALAKERAKDEARKRAGEFKSRQEAEMHSRTDALAKSWMETDKELREQYPKAFVAEEGNDADKTAHTKGFALADLLFIGPEGLTPEQVEALPEAFRNSVKAKQPLTDQDRIRLHAIARIKMANHDRHIARLKAAQERIEELESALAAYEKSEPSTEKASDGGDDKTTSKDWLEQAEDELKAMDK